MIDMIGVGPFITIPLIVSAMGGPQAMLGWIFGALFAICDGLVWAELGAAMPKAGGSYEYLQEIYGRGKLGRLFAFLFVWQLSISAPLSIASGSVGLARYAGYIWPSLDVSTRQHAWSATLPLLGPLEVRAMFNSGTIVAIGVVLVAVLLGYRRISVVGTVSKL